MDVRVDNRFSDTNTLFVRYSFNNTNTIIPGALPSGIQAASIRLATRDDPERQRSAPRAAQINNAHVFGPRLVIELKAGFSRYGIHSLPPNYGKNVAQQLGIPGVNIDLDSSGLSIISVSGLTTRWATPAIFL